MNETPLLIKGVPVKACQRIGFIEGHGRFAVELANGEFFILTSHELGEWIKASRHLDMEPEPELNVIQSAGVCGLIVGTVAAIWTVWAAKVGLL